jgi:hypothetical protein
VVPTPGAISGSRKVDVEADVQVRVRVQRGQRQLHRVAHAHLVDVAHVEDLQAGLVHEALLAGSTLRMPIWRTTFGLIAGTVPPISTSSARAVAAQAGHRHAVDVAAGRERAGVEVGVRVEPQHAQLLAGLSRQWRATALMLPMPRQWSPPSRIGRRPAAARRAPRRARRGSRPPPRPGGGSRPPAAARGWPGRRGCRGRAPPGRAFQRRLQAGHAQASGPMLAPRVPAPMSVGAPIRLTWRSWRGVQMSSANSPVCVVSGRSKP